MSLTNDSSNPDGRATVSGQTAPENTLTLRNLYERALISGNSLFVELGKYHNTYEVLESSSTKDSPPSTESSDEATIHEKALAAILDVVVANSQSSFECIRAPEPPGGVQEWWARMLSGSINDPQSAVRAQL
ncbi:MAG TPA: hypothetical protein VIJ99_00020 [Acidimicrobiales bacterium]